MDEGNLNDIININHASANISSEFFNGQENRLNNILRYQEKNKLNKQEFLEFICDSNGNPDATFQLIGPDYTGNIVSFEDDNQFETISYENKNYFELQNIFDRAETLEKGVFFSPEFTDQNTAIKSFARYVYVSLPDEQGNEQSYTLMSVYQTSKFVNVIKTSSSFNGLSTVLINQQGNYILRSSEFKAENFFRYLYIYNDLSLDQMTMIQEEMQTLKDGSFFYLNSKSEECVYVYTYIPKIDWVCITSVPVDSFHMVNLDVRFIFAFICLFASLFTMDIAYLTELNKNLKANAQNAYNANQAKTDFLSRMSHDIRTPINVIIDMTELAIQEKDKKQEREYLTNI